LGIGRRRALILSVLNGLGLVSIKSHLIRKALSTQIVKECGLLKGNIIGGGVPFTRLESRVKIFLFLRLFHLAVRLIPLVT
jgi:hypothetical protein